MTGILLCKVEGKESSLLEELQTQHIEERALLEKVEAGFETVGAPYNACKFRAARSALLRARMGEAAVARQLPS